MNPRVPSISVVIPTYNADRYIVECIESVLNQTLQPTQVIVCDDASQDGTQNIIRKYVNRYPELVEAIFNDKNLGVASNLNQGFKRAKAEYITLIAGDDLWKPEKLKLEIEALRSDNAKKWVYSDCYLIDKNSTFLRSFSRLHDGVDGRINFHVLTHQMTLRNWLAHRSLIEKVGLFDPQFGIFEDWDYKIRLAFASQVAHVPEQTVAYRQSHLGLSKSDSSIYFESLLGVLAKHSGKIRALPRRQRLEILKATNLELKTHLSRANSHQHSSFRITNKVLNHFRIWRLNMKAAKFSMKQ